MTIKSVFVRQNVKPNVSREKMAKPKNSTRMRRLPSHPRRKRKGNEKRLLP